MSVRKYRKKPIEIEAIQFTGKNWDQIAAFVNETNPESSWVVEEDFLGDTTSLTIPTLEGDMRADKDDWIIRGIKGEFYPCKPDIFDATYEEVTNANG